MSSALNVITASFGGLREVTTAPLWQWDYGQILEITGLDLPQAFEVHFSNSRKSGETITQIGTDSQVVIPDMYLTSGADIYAFVFLHDGLTDGETEYVIKIPVRERPEPSDIEPTPEQQDVITEAIAALNSAVEQCGAYVEHYPTVVDGYWYVWDEASEQFVTTGVPATGNGIESARLNQDYTLTLVFTDGTSFTTPIPIRGAQGKKGDPGAVPDFSVGTVTTLPAGSSASASITGTQEEPVLNLSIPQGQDGAITNLDTTLTVSGKAADAKAVGDAVNGVKSDLSTLDKTVNGSNVEIMYVADEYVVGSSGAFVHYNGWSRTDYIDVSGIKRFEYSNSGVATSYNCFYDENKSPLAFTNLKNTTGDAVTVPTGAKYFAYSNPTNQIQLITWLNAPHTDGLVDDVRDLSEKLGDIKIVMCDKLVALPDEQFDIHYDNIMVNRDAECVEYKEAFGSAPYGMRDMARCINPTAGTYTLSLCFGDSVPSSYNAPVLPSTISKKSATFKVISANSGSGLNRKVLLIGDSWTANGKYARELRNIFASADEPMDITLLGTMGDNAEDVGAANGYTEGHGGWSSQTYCTKASANTYTNHFYNPSSQTFDFAYYMNNCGYSSVDDVFINLGINDVENTENFDSIITYYNTMIASIRAYDPNIRIFIGLCGLPAEYEYTVPHSRTQRIKARRLLFHERLMTEYGDKENESLFIVPLHLSIDCKHDFNTEQRARSFRDSTLVDYCTDIVHPNDIAYNKIADRIRTYIKYVETI